jgi:hypothetical protein
MTANTFSRYSKASRWSQSFQHLPVGIYKSSGTFGSDYKLWNTKSTHSACQTTRNRPRISDIVRESMVRYDHACTDSVGRTFWALFVNCDLLNSINSTDIKIMNVYCKCIMSVAIKYYIVKVLIAESDLKTKLKKPLISWNMFKWTFFLVLTGSTHSWRLPKNFWYTLCISLHGVITQKTGMSISIAVRTSNIALLKS